MNASPTPAPTFTLPLPPGYAATKVDVFADPADSQPQPKGRLSVLLAGTGGPGLALGILGLVAAAAGAVLVLRRRS